MYILSSHSWKSAHVSHRKQLFITTWWKIRNLTRRGNEWMHHVCITYACSNRVLVNTVVKARKKGSSFSLYGSCVINVILLIFETNRIAYNDTYVHREAARNSWFFNSELKQLKARVSFPVHQVQRCVTDERAYRETFCRVRYETTWKNCWFCRSSDHRYCADGNAEKFSLLLLLPSVYTLRHLDF